MTNQNLQQYIYSIADNALILGQRLGGLRTWGSLETDIALTNIALDLLGQTRSYYQYIAQNLVGDDLTEDDLAFLRKEREYRNVQLVEQPNNDFAYVIVRQYFFDVFHYRFLSRLQQSKNINLEAIASKSIKEVAYHERFSGDWLKRLGDGTEESHQRAQQAVNDLWVYTDELFHTSDEDLACIDAGHGVDITSFKSEYFQVISDLLEEATLKVPETEFFQKGGKKGIHTEHMGYLLAEMQYMQRTYPDMKW